MNRPPHDIVANPYTYRGSKPLVGSHLEIFHFKCENVKRTHENGFCRVNLLSAEISCACGEPKESARNRRRLAAVDESAPRYKKLKQRPGSLTISHLRLRPRMVRYSAQLSVFSEVPSALTCEEFSRLLARF